MWGRGVETRADVEQRSGPLPDNAERPSEAPTTAGRLRRHELNRGTATATLGVVNREDARGQLEALTRAAARNVFDISSAHRAG